MVVYTKVIIRIAVHHHSGVIILALLNFSNLGKVLVSWQRS